MTMARDVRVNPGEIRLWLTSARDLPWYDALLQEMVSWLENNHWGSTVMDGERIVPGAETGTVLRYRVRVEFYLLEEEDEVLRRFL
jgi:hypothetical protein